MSFIWTKGKLTTRLVNHEYTQQLREVGMSTYDIDIQALLHEHVHVVVKAMQVSWALYNVSW